MTTPNAPDKSPTGYDTPNPSEHDDPARTSLTGRLTPTSRRRHQMPARGIVSIQMRKERVKRVDGQRRGRAGEVRRKSDGNRCGRRRTDS